MNNKIENIIHHRSKMYVTTSLHKILHIQQQHMKTKINYCRNDLSSQHFIFRFVRVFNVEQVVPFTFVILYVILLSIPPLYPFFIRVFC